MKLLKQLESVHRSKSEEIIAKYILSHIDRHDLFTSTRIAKDCQLSQPTVVRFAQSLGFEGFSQFKFALKEEINQHRHETECLSTKPFLVKTSQMIIENSEVDIHNFISLIASSDKVVLCHPSNLTNFTNSLTEDLISVGKKTICISAHFALSSLTQILTSQDVFLYITRETDIESEKILFNIARRCDSVVLKITNSNKVDKTADCTIKINTANNINSDVMFKNGVQTFVSYLCVYIDKNKF